MSCRACAAFFRRAATQKSKIPQKVCENGNCEIFENGKYQCKMCRLKKCYAVGMDSSKFQNDHDPLSSTRTYLSRGRVFSPQSLANFVGRPEFILLCEPDKASHIKSIIDVSYLIHKAIRIFQSDSMATIPYKFENSLEKITFAMEEMKIKKASQKIEVMKKIGKEESLMFFEKNFIAAAQWFAELPEFAKLDLNVKIEILKSSWLLWLRLEKLSETAEFHRRFILGGDVFMCSENACLSVQDVEMDLKWCTNYSLDQLKDFLMPDFNTLWKQSVEALIEIEPTNIEINFMLIQLSLNEAGKKHQGKILEVTERIQQIHANHLHEYYTKTVKMSNYSGRLAKLMRVIHAIEADVRERKERSHIGKIFNLFSVEYSHPEMFEFA
uniref:NR LBD domain-containing protein n=1 Tax=Caenorhabditis tropicalis TaxID=1561998 RepID=A0A1I7TAT2_9PELO